MNEQERNTAAKRLGCEPKEVELYQEAERLTPPVLSVDDGTHQRIRARMNVLLRRTERNLRQLEQLDSKQVALGIIAEPESFPHIEHDGGGDHLVASLKRAARMGKALQSTGEQLKLLEAVAKKVGVKSLKSPPPTEDRTPIPGSAWEIARDKFKKYKGSNSV